MHRRLRSLKDLDSHQHMNENLKEIDEANGTTKTNGSLLSAKQLRKAEKRKEKEKRKENKKESPIEVKSIKEFSEEVEVNRLKELLLRNHYTTNGKRHVADKMSTSNVRIALTAGYGIAGSGYGDRLGNDDDHKAEQQYSDLYSPVNYDEKYFEHAAKWVDRKYQTHRPLTQIWQTIRSATKDSKDNWMSKFLSSVAEGRIQQVTTGINHIEQVLRGRQTDENRFRFMERSELLSVIAKMIVEKLSDDRVGNNIIMLLSAGCFGPKPCHSRGHSVCSTLHLLLASLTEHDRRRVLSIRSNLEGYLPLHFAAMFGQPCQMAVLLNFGANPNVHDNYGNLPCFYVLQRNNVMMIRQLLWAGADMNSALMETVHPYRTDVDCLEVEEWLRLRLASMEEAVYGWTCSSLEHLFRINRKVSRLHQMRVNCDGDDTAQKRGFENFDDSNSFTRKIQLLIDEDDESIRWGTNDSLLLMVIPVQWTHFESSTPPEFPHLIRIGLFKSDQKTPIKFFSDAKISSGCGSPKALTSPLSLIDNGYFYLYTLPKGFPRDSNPTLNFTINKTFLGERAKHWRLLIQAFAATPVQ
ncbi:unnamed protein product, partial [Mesorhabditis belari]|uniref:ANK_REP_REGION domain-containing protein n=1 Tax=Mesorhabditis belari TaxID=2138241 RepID=A0AAF3J5Z3_9BILA